MGPVWGDLNPPDLPGVDHAVDQTRRLHAFRDAHPEWHIWCENFTWHGERPLPDGGTERVSWESLKFLLDALEKR